MPLLKLIQETILETAVIGLDNDGHAARTEAADGPGRKVALADILKRFGAAHHVNRTVASQLEIARDEGGICRGAIITHKAGISILGAA